MNTWLIISLWLWVTGMIVPFYFSVFEGETTLMKVLTALFIVSGSFTHHLPSSGAL